MANSLAEFRELVSASKDTNFLRAVKYSDIVELAKARLRSLDGDQELQELVREALASLETSGKVRSEGPGTANRVLAAVLGGFVGDAAATPSHWVYDDGTIAEKLSGPDNAFLAESVSPFYSTKTGGLSCYGDQSLATLRAVHRGVTSGTGQVDIDAYKEALHELLGANEAYGPFPEPEGYHAQANWPISTKWRMKSVIEFLGTGKPEADDHQIDAGAKTFAVAAPLSFLADLGAPASAIRAVTRVTQVSAQAEASTLLISIVLQAVVAGYSIKDAVAAAAAVADASGAKAESASGEGGGDAKAAPNDDFFAAYASLSSLLLEETDKLSNQGGIDSAVMASALQDLDDMFGDLKEFKRSDIEKLLHANNGDAGAVADILGEGKEAVAKAVEGAGEPGTFVSFVARVGKSCGLPASLVVPLSLLATKASSVGTDGPFVSLVRTAISGGGDTPGRCAIVGSIAAAAAGVDSVPLDWLKKTHVAEEVLTLTRDILLKFPDSADAIRKADELLAAIRS